MAARAGVPTLGAEAEETYRRRESAGAASLKLLGAFLDLVALPWERAECRRPAVPSDVQAAESSVLPSGSTLRTRASSAARASGSTRRRPRDPGHACGGRDGRLPRARAPRHRRCSGRRRRSARICLLPPLHERASGRAGTPAARGSRAPNGARPLRLGRVEANEAALRLARATSSGATRPLAGHLAPRPTTARPWGRGAHRPAGLQRPLRAYLAESLHISPSTGRVDEAGGEALAGWIGSSRRRGPDTVAAFFCEPVSAAALPAYSPPARFWEGVAERRDTTGSWSASTKW